jgi:hypothetical protein
MYPLEVATQIHSEQDESSPLPSNIFPSNNGYHRHPIYSYACLKAVTSLLNFLTKLHQVFTLCILRVSLIPLTMIINCMLINILLLHCRLRIKDIVTSVSLEERQQFSSLKLQIR